MPDPEAVSTARRRSGFGIRPRRGHSRLNERTGACQLGLDTLLHPVIAGYNGSSSARNALAYATSTARRLGRPLLVVYVASPGFRYLA